MLKLEIGIQGFDKYDQDNSTLPQPLIAVSKTGGTSVTALTKPLYP
jgi:hypothetical protein